MERHARLDRDEEAQPVIADVSDTPLADLFGSDDSALASSIKLLLEINSEGEHYAAHSSSLA
jgi:FXSXX-COOH protein